MGIFDLFKREDINEGIQAFKEEDKAMLIDVREVDEFRQGHIPNAKNVPLSTSGDIEKVVKDKDMPLYVYCLSGSRSRTACMQFRKMGYTNVRNIGGIGNYKGSIQR